MNKGKKSWLNLGQVFFLCSLFMFFDNFQNNVYRTILSSNIYVPTQNKLLFQPVDSIDKQITHLSDRLQTYWQFKNSLN